MMDKYAVDETDRVESKAIEIQKTAGIGIKDARAVAQTLVDTKCDSKTSKKP